MAHSWILCCLTLLGTTWAEGLFSVPLASLDRPAIEYQYTGVSWLRIGDHLGEEHLWAGGFVELRNEEEFHEEILPNHQWRGYLRIESDWHAFGNWGLSLAFFHESAHATAGMFDDGKSPYHAIWDGVYRNLNLNALESGVRWKTGQRLTILTEIRGQAYVYSRNTPEAANLQKTWSLGWTAAWELRWHFDSLNTLWASVYGRQIREGERKVSTQVHFQEGDSIVVQTVDYPVMAETWSVSLAAGYQRSIPRWHRDINLYVHWIQGQPGGYADSRQRVHWLGLAAGIGF
ncbi:MAG TPA: hypothetical protein VLM37_03315 [Fibrobacteraceae bacterium]|nr:hypothetical protein [Fibrobacteraceae bacterium]